MKVLKLLVIFAVVVGLAFNVFAAEERRTGKIVDLKGSADVKSTTGERSTAFIGMVLDEGDTLLTKGNSWAMLTLTGKEGSSAEIEVEENSELLLSELVMDKAEGTQSTLLDLAIGKILIRAEKVHGEGSSFEVQTPTSIVAVRGTVFSVEVEALE